MNEVAGCGFWDGLWALATAVMISGRTIRNAKSTRRSLVIDAGSVSERDGLRKAAGIQRDLLPDNPLKNLHCRASCKKVAPFLRPHFKRSNLEGDVRKGDASYRSARRGGTSGNVDERE